MNVFERVGRMAEAAWNELMERSKGAGSEQQEIERRYQEALERTFELRKHMVSAEEMAALRSEQAELAMRAGDEELARLALEEKLREEAACERYREQYAWCKDEVLALAEQRQRIAAGEGRGDAPRQAGVQHRMLHEELDPREFARELMESGREIGRDTLQALREASRLSGETLKEAGGNLQQELGALRGKFRHEWRNRRYSCGRTGERGKK